MVTLARNDTEQPRASRDTATYSRNNTRELVYKLEPGSKNPRRELTRELRNNICYSVSNLSFAVASVG